MNATTAQLVDHLPARKRRPSLWLALLWKEWRQQRLVFVLLAATCLGGYAIWCKANGWRGDGATLTALLAFAALCLGVNAFATDTDERSGEFLDRLPVSAWRLLIVRYLVTMALASLCFVLPVVLMTPVGDDWGLCTWGALVWGPERLVPVAFVIASSAVALTGALSRSGLGGMSTWLLAASVTAATAAMPVFPTFVTGTRLPFLAGVVLVWCVAHFWLVRVWSIHRPERVQARRVGFWVAVVLLTPVLSAMPPIAHQWVFTDPRRAVSEPFSSVSTFTSSDGRTVALSASHYSHMAFSHAETWLLDVDTGRTRRIGPRWRHAGAAGWSPDGKKLRLSTTRSFLPRGRYSRDWFANKQERVYDVADGSAKLVYRQPNAGSSGAGWLGDGTYTTWTPTGWEFMDLDTGKVQRCLNAPDDGFVGKCPAAWQWLQSAIVAAQYHEDETGKGWLRIGRSAPDLEKVQTRCIPADPAVAKADLHAARISPDGRWLLLRPPTDPRAPRDQPGRPFGVLSLDDGSGHLLQVAPARCLDRPFFTPDGSLLVAQVNDGLRVWDLASGQAKPEVGIPLPSPSWYPAGISMAVSPKPPWRVAVAYAEYKSTYVVDLAKRQTTEIPPPPIAQPYSQWRRQVSWLDNDRLLVEYPGDYHLWVMNADGSSQRQVFP